MVNGLVFKIWLIECKIESSNYFSFEIRILDLKILGGDGRKAILILLHVWVSTLRSYQLIIIQFYLRLNEKKSLCKF